MAMGSPEWIEQSLARLEGLEQERDAHEAALEAAEDAGTLREHSEAIDRLDEEIKRLYAALEAVAEEGEEGDEEEVVQTNPLKRSEAPAAAAPTPAPTPVHTRAPAPRPVGPPPEELEDNPFGPPSRAAAPAHSPAAAPAAPAIFAAPEPSYDTGGDAEPGSGGALKWIAVLLLVVGGGAGGLFFLRGKPPKPAPAAPAAPARVIDASVVPDDTQGPRGAQGQDGVTRTPDRELGGGGRRRGGGGGRGGGGRGGKSSDGKDIQLGGGDDDPLG
jgi:hypothetical protein